MTTDSDRRQLDDSIAGYRGFGIVTGMIEYASPDDLAPFHELFGSGPDFAIHYNLYFHWYNLIHELAHIARRAVGLIHAGTTPILEEKYANDFAVAYWRNQGRNARLGAIGQIVERALLHTIKKCSQKDILEYYGDPVVFEKAGQNPKEYGYIQFSLVLNAILGIRHSFQEELKSQGFMLGTTKRQVPLQRITSADPMQKIVDHAVSVLGDLGLELGNVRVFPHYNPNEHRII